MVERTGEGDGPTADPDPDTPSALRRRGIAPGLAAAIAVTVVVELGRVGGGVTGSALETNWQLLDLHELRTDPLAALWYLHIQPPLHNAVVAAIAVSPLPEAGALFAWYAACLVGLAVTLAVLARRAGLPPLLAGLVGGLAVANPGLLYTATLASYEIPLALGLGLLALAAQRYADGPSRRRLLAVSAILLALTMTRSLLHPVWLVAMVGLLALVRPVGRRTVALALGLPLLVVVAWMGKNQLLFGTATLSSWDGFNLQRGVTNPMERADVEAAVDDGAVSALALERPWLTLDSYAAVSEPCRPHHANPVVSTPGTVVHDVVVPNFNHECFLPLYAQARRDAMTLARREPGTYLRRRLVALALSHENPRGVAFFGEEEPQRSWMDRVYDPLLATTTLTVDTGTWNRSLLGLDLSIQISWTLVAVSIAALARTFLAYGRLGRGWRGRHELATWDVVWLVMGTTYLFVVLGGDLVELGENGRFRSMLDPVMLTLVSVELWRLVERVAPRGADANAGRSEAPAG